MKVSILERLQKLYEKHKREQAQTSAKLVHTPSIELSLRSERELGIMLGLKKAIDLIEFGSQEEIPGVLR